MITLGMIFLVILLLQRYKPLGYVSSSQYICDFLCVFIDVFFLILLCSVFFSLTQYDLDKLASKLIGTLVSSNMCILEVCCEFTGVCRTLACLCKVMFNNFIIYPFLSSGWCFISFDQVYLCCHNSQKIAQKHVMQNP